MSTTWNIAVSEAMMDAWAYPNPRYNRVCWSISVIKQKINKLKGTSSTYGENKKLIKHNILLKILWEVYSLKMEAYTEVSGRYIPHFSKVWRHDSVMVNLQRSETSAGDTDQRWISRPGCSALCEEAAVTHKVRGWVGFRTYWKEWRREQLLFLQGIESWSLSLKSLYEFNLRINRFENGNCNTAKIQIFCDVI